MGCGCVTQHQEVLDAIVGRPRLFLYRPTDEEFVKSLEPEERKDQKLLLAYFRLLRDGRFDATPELVDMVRRKGVPQRYRWLAWRSIAGWHALKRTGEYERMAQQEADPRTVDAIGKDMDRTFPSCEEFNEERKLQLSKILQVYSCLYPKVGYCQGMNFVAGFILLSSEVAPESPPEDAFFLFLQIMARYRGSLLFCDGLPLLKLLTFQFQSLLESLFPDVQRHFVQENVTPELYLTKWFLTVFTQPLPMPMASRLWDLIVCDGLQVLVHLALASVKLLKPKLVRETTEGILELLSLKGDVGLPSRSSLVQTALGLRVGGPCGPDLDSRLGKLRAQWAKAYPAVAADLERAGLELCGSAEMVSREEEVVTGSASSSSGAIGGGCPATPGAPMPDKDMAAGAGPEVQMLRHRLRKLSGTSSRRPSGASTDDNSGRTRSATHAEASGEAASNSSRDSFLGAAEGETGGAAASRDGGRLAEQAEDGSRGEEQASSAATQGPGLPGHALSPSQAHVKFSLSPAAKVGAKTSATTDPVDSIPFMVADERQDGEDSGTSAPSARTGPSTRRGAFGSRSSQASSEPSASPPTVGSAGSWRQLGSGEDDSPGDGEAATRNATGGGGRPPEPLGLLGEEEHGGYEPLGSPLTGSPSTSGQAAAAATAEEGPASFEHAAASMAAQTSPAEACSSPAPSSPGSIRRQRGWGVRRRAGDEAETSPAGSGGGSSSPRCRATTRSALEAAAAGSPPAAPELPPELPPPLNSARPAPQLPAGASAPSVAPVAGAATLVAAGADSPKTSRAKHAVGTL